MRRLLPSFALVLLPIALLPLAACGTLAPAAASVDGKEISRDDLQEELEAINGNELFRQTVFRDPDVAGEGDGTFKAQVTAQVLTRQIYFELVHQEFVRKKLRIGPAERELAKLSFINQIGQGDAEQGQRVYDAFSRSYQETLLQRQAEVLLVQGALAGVPINDETLRERYDALKDQFEEACVEHILVDTAEVATQVREELSAGGDFAAIARARSTDPSAAQNGGDLGCASPDNYVPAFADAARSLPVGELSQPVQTDFGFHVLRVYERKSPSYADVRADILRAVEQDTQQPLYDWLEEELREVDIKVDDRYGRLEGEGLDLHVEPPGAPTTTVPTAEVPGTEVEQPEPTSPPRTPEPDS